LPPLTFSAKPPAPAATNSPVTTTFFEGLHFSAFFASPFPCFASDVVVPSVTVATVGVPSLLAAATQRRRSRRQTLR
jgi:hypothetical protein